MGRILLGAAIPAIVLFAWWLAAESGTSVVPKFSDVFRVLGRPFETPKDLYSRSLAFSFMMTMIRLTCGFALAVVTAVPLGLWAGQSRVVDRLLETPVNMARPINPIVLLPIATAFFGISSIGTFMYGENAWKHDISDQVQTAMIIILWWGAFFPIFISAAHGVKAVRVSYLESMRMMAATKWQIFTRVLWPHSLPYIANGMRIAMGVTWLVLIAAEIFPGTRSGLGYMLCVACKTTDYQYTFSAIMVIAVVAYLCDLAMQRFERKAGHWQARER